MLGINRGDVKEMKNIGTDAKIFFSYFVLFSGQESMHAESQASTMNLRAVLETKVILYPICIY